MVHRQGSVNCYRMQTGTAERAIRLVDDSIELYVTLEF